jgi:peptidase C39-like protein
MRRLGRGVWIGLALLALSGATRPPDRPPPVMIAGVPHVRQEPDFCGEACVAMVLRKLGYDVDQRAVFDRTGLDPRHGRGANTPELKRAVEAFGFRPGPVWFYVSPADAPRALERQLEALYADIARGVPSIVCMHYDRGPNAPEHFRLVLGYDRVTNEIIFHEPAQNEGAYKRMSSARFMELWPLKYSRKDWTVIRIALEPGRIDVGRRPDGVTPAAHAQHVIKMKAKIPHGFATRIVGPFLVIGDEPPSRVEHHAETVEWAVEHLKRDFHMREPANVIDVWLLGSTESYVDHAVRLFGKRPSTPYGFFSPEHRALFMNIATGGGTLVHEVVHPFIDASFPSVPAWFNEGLASLYEAVEERNGQLWGRPNWRLDGLKHAIRAGKLASFAAMTGDSDARFYASSTGYAQARYLCLYLQEKGLLHRYYDQFSTRVASDPTGYKTLVQVLGNPDMTRFEKQWRDWALALAAD